MSFKNLNVEQVKHPSYIIKYGLDLVSSKDFTLVFSAMNIANADFHNNRRFVFQTVRENGRWSYGVIKYDYREVKHGSIVN